jgi:hypothetical protein
MGNLAAELTKAISYELGLLPSYQGDKRAKVDGSQDVVNLLAKTRFMQEANEQISKLVHSTAILKQAQKALSEAAKKVTSTPSMAAMPIRLVRFEADLTEMLQFHLRKTYQNNAKPFVKALHFPTMAEMAMVGKAFTGMDFYCKRLTSMVLAGLAQEVILPFEDATETAKIDMGMMTEHCAEERAVLNACIAKADEAKVALGKL